MGDNSGIEWTDATWNPTTGCTKVSPGCDHCYAERITKRLRHNGGVFDEVVTHPDRLDMPLHWKRSRYVFVDSMSDLFHPKIPEAYVASAWEVMRDADQHSFQILTKRASRMKRLAEKLNRPPLSHVWLGTSIENRDYLHRMEILRGVSAEIRFVSFEPLIGPIGEIDFDGIHWAIVGGESGPEHRPIKEEWVREIRDQCMEQSVPFFFKQWGGITPKSGGRILDGRTWDEKPVRLETNVRAAS